MLGQNFFPKFLSFGKMWLLKFSLVFQIVLWASASTISSDEKLELEYSYQRDVVASVNPNCPENECSNFTLVHIQSRGSSDVLHHFWTMERVPTFFYARTDVNTTVNINWHLLLSENRSGSIQFSAKPLYSAAVCLTKFIMFDDVNDTGVLPPLTDRDGYSISAFSPQAMKWELKVSNSSGNASAFATFRLESYEGVQVDASTNIEITLTAYGDRERSLFLPHLMYTENTTQVDLVFDQVPSKHSFNNARLAVEIVTMVTEPSANFSMEISRSLDDEYTPGVFKLMEIHSPLRQHFLQWRPVCYTSTVRNIGFSSGVEQTAIRNIEDPQILLNNSLLDWIDSTDVDVGNLLIQGFNLSFGIQGDGFYKATNYTSWTMVTGHGRPVADRFSLMVMLVIAVGLGLPVCVLLLGGAGIAFRNYRRRKDDLLLSN